jgi:hypothetical protein
VRRAPIALVICVAAALVASAPRAEHEIYYRYTILGFVKDARGKPLAGREVKIIRDRTGFSYLGETDAKGLYVVVLRLGDESIGESLTVQVGRLTTTVTARFEVHNRSDERGTRLDLDAGRFVERPAWFPSTLALFLAR